MKTLTIKGKCDGFGAQYQAIMSGIAYSNYMNYKYIHTPFQKIAHDGNVEELNKFIGIPSSDNTKIDIAVKCCGEVLVDLDRKSRSEITERCIRLIKGLNDTPMDISHYNALLKVR